MPNPTLEWILTDRCGFAHTGYKVGVPEVIPYGQANMDTNDVKSVLYGRALNIYKGWARAYSPDGTVDILGINTAIPSFTLSFFAKHMTPADVGCSCETGPIFTSVTNPSEEVTGSKDKLGVAIYNENLFLHWDKQDCGLDIHSWGDATPANYNNWVHVTLAYNAESKLLTRYLNGKYHQSRGNFQIIGCGSIKGYMYFSMQLHIKA